MGREPDALLQVATEQPALHTPDGSDQGAAELEHPGMSALTEYSPSLDAGSAHLLEHSPPPPIRTAPPAASPPPMQHANPLFRPTPGSAQAKAGLPSAAAPREVAEWDSPASKGAVDVLLWLLRTANSVEAMTQAATSLKDLLGGWWVRSAACACRGAAGDAAAATVHMSTRSRRLPEALQNLLCCLQRHHGRGHVH